MTPALPDLKVQTINRNRPHPNQNLTETRLRITTILADQHLRASVTSHNNRTHADLHR